MMLALQGVQMGKRKTKRSEDFNDTLITILVALFFGACAVLAIEAVLGALEDAGWQLIGSIPSWQLHMGAACGGTITFFAYLYILQFIETDSKLTAWRSSAPWLPLVGLTALATTVYIPFYIVFLIGGGYAVWAYRRTRDVRRGPRKRKGIA
jgi:hypothetical protein